MLALKSTNYILSFNDNDNDDDDVNTFCLRLRYPNDEKPLNYSIDEPMQASTFFVFLLLTE